MNDCGLDTLLGVVWARLERGAADRKHPARHPALATIGSGGPEIRTLVLRAARRADSVLEMHTDAASPKAEQIAADPRVSLHVWLPRDRLQIRARAIAELRPGDPALFASLPQEARGNYGGPAPGAEPEPAAQDGDPERFMVIRCTLREIDALVLDTPHRRALFTGPEWRGRWIAP